MLNWLKTQGLRFTNNLALLLTGAILGFLALIGGVFLSIAAFIFLPYINARLAWFQQAKEPSTAKRGLLTALAALGTFALYTVSFPLQALALAACVVVWPATAAAFAFLNGWQEGVKKGLNGVKTYLGSLQRMIVKPEKFFQIGRTNRPSTTTALLKLRPIAETAINNYARDLKTDKDIKFKDLPLEDQTKLTQQIKFTFFASHQGKRNRKKRRTKHFNYFRKCELNSMPVKSSQRLSR